MEDAKKNELTAQKDVAPAKESRNKVTDYSLGIFGTSDNFIMAMQMAQALAASTIVPKEYQGNPSNCLIAIEQAQRMKISPLMVMQNLFPIQGRPSWSSKFLIAMINSSKKFDMELQFDEVKDKDGKPYACTAWTERNGRRVEGMTVDMQIAKDEGWYGKNGSKWKTMPQLMLRYRAASFFSSLNCPELTLGIYTTEEILDGDFKEYPIENIAEQVQREIMERANTEEFVPAAIEEKPEPPAIPHEQKEKETVTARKGSRPTPEFMQ